MSFSSSVRARRAWVAALFIVGAAVALELVRPLRAGSVGFDSAASVLHFERIVSGRHLESFVTATPKPLLTVLYGGLMAVFNDWRVISIAAVGAFAGSVALGSAAAERIGGGVAGAAAAIVLLASPRLLGDVAIAYALPWAALLWFAAALAVTGERRRPVIAGLALGAATLARLETIALVATIAVALVVATWLGRRRGRPLDRSWWGVLVAFLALPIMVIHDLLLTGDPLFFVSVSAVFSTQAAAAVLTPIELLAALGARYGREPLLLALAVVGVAWLVRRRAVVPLVGLGGLSFGVAGFLLALAIRGTYVTERYFGAIDIAIGLTAALGAGAIADWLVRSVARRRPGDANLPAPRSASALAVLPAVLAVILVAVATWPPPSLTPSTRSSDRKLLVEARDADVVVPIVACAIRATGGIPMPPPSTTLAPQTADDLKVIVPVLLRPRLAHDLGIPLGAIGGVGAASLDPAHGFLPSGWIIVHDRRSDRPATAFRNVEVSAPTSRGGLELTPLVANAAQGLWVVWIGRPGGPPAPTGCRT